MAKSRYEKYICKLPAVMDLHEDGTIGEKLPKRITADTLVGAVVRGGRIIDTGPMVWCSKSHFKDAPSIVEYGLIGGDFMAAVPPHINADYDECFMFLGTNPDDPLDLGAEATIWLGEDEELEEVKITSTSSVFIPRGLAHMPISWKNVKRPCMFLVVMFDTHERILLPASTKGRPPTPPWPPK